RCRERRARRCWKESGRTWRWPGNGGYCFGTPLVSSSGVQRRDPFGPSVG
ncbi:unnamed protein product, partial [Ascophyllum nodosum]